MPEFEPVAAARRLVHEISKQGTSSEAEGLLVDYIDAVTGALKLARPYVEKIADEWNHAPADALAHTIRHLLDD